jgi:oligopeptide/dipeptide ABC transporter ATP-binding protein
MNGPLLSIRGLCVAYGDVRAVDGVDLDVAAGDCLGVVGESGSGKSATFLAVMGLLRGQGRITRGSVRFEGRELVGLSAREYRMLRGGTIAMTLQDAQTALNPALTIGTQIEEAVRAHTDLPARPRAIEMLRRVGIADPARRLRDWPHQFSGGMPTALDVTVQAQVLELIAAMRQELGMSVVLITHDLGVVAEHCDRVAVMYAGEIVETGPTRDVIETPAHPYTRGLLASLPRLDAPEHALRPIDGQVPDPARRLPGCRFLPRCAHAREACREPVAMRMLEGQRQARCVLA